MNKKTGWLIASLWMFLLPFLFAANQCNTDPPPPEGEGALILGIKTILPENDQDRILSGGQNENLENLESMEITVERVEIDHAEWGLMQLPDTGGARSKKGG